MRLFLVFFMQAYLYAAFVPLENIDAGAVAASRGSVIKQLHPNVFVGNKTLPYYETDKSIKNADTLHFVCEKINFDNLFKLHDYVNLQNEALDRGDVDVPKIIQLIAKEALDRFTHSLNSVFLSSQEVLDEFDAVTPEGPTAQLTKLLDDLSYCNDTRDSGAITSLNSILDSSVYDVWIAYGTRQDPNTTWPIDYNNNAEMLMTFMGSATCPFDTQLGFSRNCRIFYASAMPHINLSVQLSGFAMSASEMAYGTPKNYMITQGVPSNAKALMAYFESKGMKGSVYYPADMRSSADQSDPDSLYATRPLNNLDDKNWLIIPQGEATPISFQRPRWFPVDSQTAYEQHFYLTNAFDQILAVDALSFINYWNTDY